MFDMDKMDFSALLAKPKNTKLFVPDKCKVQLFRGKLGQSLTPDKQDYELGDSKMSQKLWDYKCLHDKHLRKFFRHPEKKKRLIELGLISPDGKAQCSIKEFNDYVEYLKSIPLKQGTSEFKPSLHMTCQSKGFSSAKKKDRRMKQKFINQYKEAHTLHGRLHTNTLEHDNNCFFDLKMKKETEELRLIDLEEEEGDVSVEDLKQTPREEKVEMFDQDKMDISALLAKPKNTKIFVPDKCKMHFFRGKLGQSLTPDKQDYELGDSKMSQILWDYKCLHDKHLRKFFRHPEKKKRLIELGLISPDGKVQCSVNEFNDYVEYLKSIPLKQDTSEFKPSLLMTSQIKGFSSAKKKDRRMKQKLTDQDKDKRTLHIYSYSLECDNDQVFDFKTEELRLIDLEEEDEEESFRTEVADVSVEEIDQTPRKKAVEMATSKPPPSLKTKKKLKKKESSSSTWVNVQPSVSTQEKTEETAKEKPSVSTQEKTEETAKENDSRGSIWSIFMRVWKAVQRPKSAPAAI